MNEYLKKIKGSFARLKRCKDKMSLGGYLGFILSISFMYYLILGPNHTFLSLSTLIHFIVHLTRKEQLLVVSLIPIYLSILIFGGGIIGSLFGHHLQKKLSKRGQEN